jgi:hypothetical protein
MRMGITIDIKRGSGNIEIKSWVPTMSFPQNASTRNHQAISLWNFSAVCEYPTSRANVGN